MFHTVINSLSNILAGDKQPCVHAIVGTVITHIGSKIHAVITDQDKLQFKVFINIVEHGHSIVMNGEDVVYIAQDVRVLSIAANVNFGLDPHLQVGWARFSPHMSCTVNQVLVEIRSSTLKVV